VNNTALPCCGHGSGCPRTSSRRCSMHIRADSLLLHQSVSAAFVPCQIMSIHGIVVAKPTFTHMLRCTQPPSITCIINHLSLHVPHRPSQPASAVLQCRRKRRGATRLAHSPSEGLCAPGVLRHRRRSGATGSSCGHSCCSGTRMPGERRSVSAISVPRAIVALLSLAGRVSRCGLQLFTAKWVKYASVQRVAPPPSDHTDHTAEAQLYLPLYSVCIVFVCICSSSPMAQRRSCIMPS